MSVDHDPPAAYDDLNVRSIALVGGVGAVLVFVAIVAVQVMYFRYNEAEYQDKVLAVPNRQATETIATQFARLEKPGEGASEGEKSVPIEDAMASVVAEYRERRQAEESPEDDQANTPTDADAEQPAPE